MANHCNNTIEIHGNLVDLQSLHEAIEKDGFCEAIIPIGDRHASEVWGCKHDMTISHLELVDNGDGSGWLIVDGDTPWSPPMAVLEKLTEQYSDTEAWWVELGAGFCGQMISGEVKEWEGVRDLGDIPAGDLNCMLEGLHDWLADEEVMNSYGGIDWSEATDEAEPYDV